MSFINHLIKRAKEAERYCTLDVPVTKVGGLVEHIIGCGWNCGRDRIRRELLEGNVYLFGCRLRVTGQPKSDPGPVIIAQPLYGTKVHIDWWRDPDHPKVLFPS